MCKAISANVVIGNALIAAWDTASGQGVTVSAIAEYDVRLTRILQKTRPDGEDYCTRYSPRSFDCFEETYPSFIERKANGNLKVITTNKDVLIQYFRKGMPSALETVFKNLDTPRRRRISGEQRNAIAIAGNQH